MKSMQHQKLFLEGHNPYFSRWFSAICIRDWENYYQTRHNPYFSRWFSAMPLAHQLDLMPLVTILILVDGFLQYYCMYLHEVNI